MTGIFVGAPARATFWAEPNVAGMSAPEKVGLGRVNVNPCVIARSDTGSRNKRTSQADFLGTAVYLWSRVYGSGRAWLRRSGPARPTAAAGAVAKQQHWLSLAACRAARTATARHEVLYRVAGTSSCIRRQRGDGKWSSLLRALLRRAGAPSYLLPEQLRSIKYSIGLCPRCCFRCQVPASVCLMRHLICSPPSCVSILGHARDFRISSESWQGGAFDEHAGASVHRDRQRVCRASCCGPV